MTLPTSPPISLNDVAVDLGRASGDNVNLQEGRFYLGYQGTYSLQDLLGLDRAHMGYEDYQYLEVLITVDKAIVSLDNLFVELRDTGNYHAADMIGREDANGYFFTFGSTGDEKSVVSHVSVQIADATTTGFQITVESSLRGYYAVNDYTVSALPYSVLQEVYSPLFLGVTTPPVYRE